MSGPVAENEAWLAALEALVGAEADIESAKTAFETTRGDFKARFSAAVESLIKPLVRPEIFIDIPAEPELLTRGELETLMREAEVVFSRARPSKSELLSHLDAVKRRQENRPSWVPRQLPDGSAAPAALAPGAPQDGWPLQAETVTSFPEFDEITVEVLESYEGRPERKLMSGGVGELEIVLHALLGVGGGEAPDGDVLLDDVAIEALVPDAVCWWPRDPERSLRASQDPGVAAELLATVATIGGVAVADNASAGLDLAARALAATGDWRYSRRWRLDGWEPGEPIPFLATAQAAVAGWADGGESGLLVYVYGGGLNALDGLSGTPLPLHSYLLCITRSSASDDGIGVVHRLGFACPGEHWCRRGGCGELAPTDLDGDLLPVVTAGQAADLAIGDSGRIWDEYRRRYGTGSVFVDEAETVLDCAETLLSRVGWQELERSEWEGGMEILLVRRGRTCLLVEYDPATRQVALADGGSWFELFLEIAEEDGIPAPDDVDVEPWSGDRRQISVVGLHPHADGRLHGPESFELATRQLSMFFRESGVGEGTTSS
ncbi:hypothetical protein M8542_12965 [Amycolatopsis sp. OK19-0408]|uniref:Uncharacterized protein n=1 Tax=Amycolatopsis iheyensis TaxID=2945988 RepID=A0A9X2SIT6_9PSEU|nr:hypothetical protein [Amycolatopsis iheyensis]MCR6483729.1 hypothetical protein [Amycolatopsis iheyensis]